MAMKRRTLYILIAIAVILSGVILVSLLVFLLGNTSPSSSTGLTDQPTTNNSDIVRMRAVKEMMQHAWKNYKQYAWGKNELKPLSKKPHLSGVFGGGDLGATIVDSLDTLYLMDMMNEFREGRDWVRDHLRIGEAVSGMFALASTTLDNSMSARYMEVAENLTNTCHESYIRSETRLGPETMRFSGAVEARGVHSYEKVYLLRPETFESYFIMWRLTKKQQYRDWGWEAVQALEKHCRVDGGYSGLQNVYDANSEHDDEQPSYFLAESLKYLYLLFADDSLLPLDQWVFNTEAHPLPVRGRNPQYRRAPPPPPDAYVASASPRIQLTQSQWD